MAKLTSPELPDLLWALRLLADPFKWNSKTELELLQDVPIDCCVRITYGDVRQARELLARLGAERVQLD